MKYRIREIRKENDLTQKEFAERLGIKQNTVASYEMGRIGVSDSVVVSICREFNIVENWLRTGREPKYAIINDDYTKITADIDKHDPKARQAIIDYWNLSESDKELWWKWVERYLKNDGGGK